MTTEFMTIIEYLERDRCLDKEVLFKTIEDAIFQAAQKSRKLNLADFGEVKVHIDRKTGQIDVFSGNKKVTPKDFGRIAAQTARQVIMQKMREAEVNTLYEEFKKKEGELVNGTVRRFEAGNVILDVGKVEAILPKKEQAAKEKYQIYERMRTYVLEVNRTNMNLKILVSRTHPNLVKKLFEFEVPEIYEGLIKIKAIAREAGDRTKIAVFTESNKIDSVGACVGLRGARVKNIVNELHGEKIDIVRWDKDMAVFIKNALAPAEINKIILSEKERRCEIIVAEDQLSLAIGKRGQNARLAAKLTGWNIDIHTGKKDATAIESLFKPEEDEKSMEDKMEGAVKELIEIPGVGRAVAAELVQAGFTSINQFAEVDKADLIEIPGIGEKLAEKIIEFARNKAQDGGTV